MRKIEVGSEVFSLPSFTNYRIYFMERPSYSFYSIVRKDGDGREILRHVAYDLCRMEIVRKAIPDVLDGIMPGPQVLDFPFDWKPF